MKLTCITIDIEEEFLKNRTVLKKQTIRLLSLFKKHQVRATFFICGYLAEQEAGLIKKISQNHEIAAHGYTHHNLKRLCPESLEAEIKKARSAFLKIGLDPKGFRCPFLIIPDQLERVLIKNQFQYDSSQSAALFTYYRTLYSFSRKKIKGIKEIPLQAFSPLKLPLSLTTIRLLGENFFYRFVPGQINNFLIHPWELTEACQKNLSFREKLAMNSPFYLNTGPKAFTILENLLIYLKTEGYHFITCQEWPIKQAVN
ncbi:MAG: polysaccharide deacetylase family protein [Candidatus Pacebacteria bacterium]|nr:polysaccharide deacetylase family protein [Candidatus Paceibacterota bacterium]